MTVPAKTYTLAEADAQRLRDLAAISEDADEIFVEVVYHKQWVRFSLSAMEAKYLSTAELWDRHFGKALRAVQVTLAETSEGAAVAASSSSSE
jgi:hypothetical protein